VVITLEDYAEIRRLFSSGISKRAHCQKTRHWISFGNA